MPRWVDGTPRHVQVRPRRRVHRRPQDAAQARPRQDRAGDRARACRCRPRDVVAACLPDPLTLGDKMTGKTCAGLWVTGTGTDGAAARGLPVPRGRQRVDDEGVRRPGGRVADRDEPGRRARAARDRRLVGRRRARPGGVRLRAVPRPAARRLRPGVGHPGARPADARGARPTSPADAARPRTRAAPRSGVRLVSFRWATARETSTSAGTRTASITWITPLEAATSGGDDGGAADLDAAVGGDGELEPSTVSTSPATRRATMTFAATTW